MHETKRAENNLFVSPAEWIPINLRADRSRKPSAWGIRITAFSGLPFFTPVGLLVYSYSKGIHIGSFREYLYRRGRKENRKWKGVFLLAFLSLLLLNFSIFESVRRRDFPLKKRKKKKKKKFDLLLLGFERRRLRLHTQEDRERRSVFAHFASFERRKEIPHKKRQIFFKKIILFIWYFKVSSISREISEVQGFFCNRRWKSSLGWCTPRPSVWEAKRGTIMGTYTQDWGDGIPILFRPLYSLSFLSDPVLSGGRVDLMRSISLPPSALHRMKREMISELREGEEGNRSRNKIQQLLKRMSVTNTFLGVNWHKIVRSLQMFRRNDLFSAYFSVKSSSAFRMASHLHLLIKTSRALDRTQTLKWCRKRERKKPEPTRPVPYWPPTNALFAQKRKKRWCKKRFFLCEMRRLTQKFFLWIMFA